MEESSSANDISDANLTPFNTSSNDGGGNQEQDRENQGDSSELGVENLGGTGNRDGPWQDGDQTDTHDQGTSPIPNEDETNSPPVAEDESSQEKDKPQEIQGKNLE